MKKLWSQCFPEKPLRSRRSNLSDSNVESVEIDEKEYHRDDHKNQMNINDLPLEILYLIFEKLDKEAVFNCFYVCRIWRTIVFKIAHNQKGMGRMVWCFLYKQYLMDGYYQQNSNTNNLPYIEIIESCLNWNHKCSVSLSKSVNVTAVVHMTVYREYIIVVSKAGVKYYDKKTFKIKKTIRLKNCTEFIENDFMVATSRKYKDDGYKLKLFGKCTFDDNEWESQITQDLSEIVSAKKLYVRLFKIQKNHCFVINLSNNPLYSHQWQPAENPTEWFSSFRCRYYGGTGKVLAMHLGRNQVYLLTSSGALLCYHRRGGVNITKLYTFSQIIQPGYVQLVHRYNVILSVPEGHPDRVMRIAGDEKLRYPILYRFEMSKLTCVVEHGIFLFLGFSDGKVKIIRPMGFSRGSINKHLIDLSVFGKGPPAPVVSIAVHVDDGKQLLFIATTTCVYRLIPTFPNEKNIWDKENRAGISCVPCVPCVELISI